MTAGDAHALFACAIAWCKVTLEGKREFRILRRCPGVSCCFRTEAREQEGRSLEASTHLQLCGRPYDIVVQEQIANLTPSGAVQLG